MACELPCEAARRCEVNSTKPKAQSPENSGTTLTAPPCCSRTISFNTASEAHQGPRHYQSCKGKSRGRAAKVAHAKSEKEKVGEEDPDRMRSEPQREMGCAGVCLHGVAEAFLQHDHSLAPIQNRF